MSLRSDTIFAASEEVNDLLIEIPRLWWMFCIRALLTLTVSGICFFLSSSMTTLLLRPAGFVLLQVLFSLYVMATGFILLTGTLYAFDAKLRHRKVLLADAIVNLAIGLFFFITLALSMQWILMLFAAHSIAVGAFYLVIASRMKAATGQPDIAGSSRPGFSCVRGPLYGAPYGGHAHYDHGDRKSIQRYWACCCCFSRLPCGQTGRSCLEWPDKNRPQLTPTAVASDRNRSAWKCAINASIVGCKRPSITSASW